jgi:GT2 family glycosyltransferase
MDRAAITAQPAEMPTASAPTDVAQPSPPIAAPSQAMLVLGMHRSGTSALARLLNLLGVDLGRDLLPPAADNELGFWEHRGIQSVHERLLQSLRHDWNSVSPLPTHWWERREIEPFKQQLQAILRDEFFGRATWGVKDPRLCQLLPLWQPMLAEMRASPRCLLILRNPAEVARSLARRDGMAPSRSHLLWCRSLIDAERDSRGLPRVLVRYESIVADWRQAARRMAAGLQMDWPTPPDAAAPEIDQFIRPSLRHHLVADDEEQLAQANVPEVVRRLYAAARATSDLADPSQLQSAAEDAAAELQVRRPALSRFIADAESDRVTAALKHDADLSTLHQLIRSSQDQESALRAANDFLEKRAAAMQEHATWLEQHNAHVKQHAAGVEQHAAEVERRAIAANELAAAMKDRATWLEEHNANLERHARGVEERAVIAEQLAAATESQRAALEAQRAALAAELARAADQRAHSRHETAAAQQSIERLRAVSDQQADRLAQLETDLERTRSTLHTTYLVRDSVGRRLSAMFRSRLWTLARPGWMLARALGHLRVTLDQLEPLTGAGRDEHGFWTGAGYAQFLIPILPTSGWARLKMTLRCSLPSRACLYFDTGNAFHPGEHFDLGPVEGETTIDRLVPLRTVAYAIRFDAIQLRCNFSLQAFSFEPLSMPAANLGALAVNIRKSRDADATEPRPSFAVGLKLLAGGQVLEFHRRLIANATTIRTTVEYDLWLKRHAITDADRQRMRQTIASWPNPPLISVVLPVYNVEEVYLRACIESVLRQTYPHWELCIADDASPKPHIKPVLAEYAARDPRIKVVYRPTNGNISAASNSALELVTGPYTALLDHDDELTEHALFIMAQALVADPSLDMIYSDEDKLTPAGKRYDPFFKPDWSPEYFLACMYTCHLGVYRTALIKAVGGWRSEFDSSQDYDLVLRIVSTRPKMLHIPDVLYHWRAIPSSAASDHAAKPEAPRRAAAALQQHINSMGRQGRIEPGPTPGYHRVRYDILGSPLVSIIIPTAARLVHFRGRSTWFVLECVKSIRRKSTYQNLEIIVLDDNSMSPELAAELSNHQVKRVPFDKPFNFSSKINLGVAESKGQQLLLLNDDVEVISPDWIQSQLEFAQWDEIGIVGPQLLFDDDTLQHCGVTLLNGAPGHPFYRFPANHNGYFNSAQVHRNWSAVTAACMMTRADVFREVGGFDEAYPINYGDADYCLKVRATGRRIVYMPYARLYHHESSTKPGTYPHELERFKAAWLSRIPVDPYYNPNLTMRTGDFRVE